MLTLTTIETVSGTFLDLADPQPEHIFIKDIAWALSRQARFAGHTLHQTPYTVAQHTVAVSRYVEEALTPATPRQQLFLRYINSRIVPLELATVEAEAAAVTPVKSLVELEQWQFFKERAQEITETELQTCVFHGLMHDFAEAYLVDLPNPVKRLPGIGAAYREVEAKLDEIIFKALGLGNIQPEFWSFSHAVVRWADLHALQLEAYHLLPSRGKSWNIPLEPLPFAVLSSFRQPISNAQAHQELLDRFQEVSFAYK